MNARKDLTAESASVANDVRRASFAGDVVAEERSTQPQTDRTDSRPNSMADRSPILARCRDRNLGPGEYRLWWRAKLKRCAVDLDAYRSPRI